MKKQEMKKFNKGKQTRLINRGNDQIKRWRKWKEKPDKRRQIEETDRRSRVMKQRDIAFQWQEDNLTWISPILALVFLPYNASASGRHFSSETQAQTC